ncbi:MAG: hypothetical protein MRK01_12885 [Candidatus Scalindua sp.]|nr:hypothetical protein [Candidatus Scalindua sp.]
MNLSKYIVSAGVCFVFCLFYLAFPVHVEAESEDFIRKPQDSYHQSFAPYENPIHIPSPKPKGVTIRVEEKTTYEIVVDEKKLQTNTLTMDDLELNEVKEKGKINFHQVDCYFYAKVKQTQTKSTDYITKMRWREGQQYWLSDGGKYVEWDAWSEWYDNKSRW